jgi:hypothetical protein
MFLQFCVQSLNVKSRKRKAGHLARYIAAVGLQYHYLFLHNGPPAEFTLPLGPSLIEEGWVRGNLKLKVVFDFF